MFLGGKNLRAESQVGADESVTRIAVSVVHYLFKCVINHCGVRGGAFG
jgi:hypothetical protein